MKKLLLAVCVLILASYCQQTQARNIPMTIGGAALASYFGYGAYKCVMFINKSDEELTDLVEQEYIRRLQKDPTRIIAVQPQDMVPLLRKAMLATLIVIYAPLTGLGGYLVKRGLTI